MRDPRKKKRRDLRRKLRSVQCSHSKLFARYHPQWSDCEPGTEKIDWEKWNTPGFHEEASLQESLWKRQICGYEPYWSGAPPAWFRRQENCLLRARQKAAMDKAVRDDAWEDFVLPLKSNNVRWLWW